MNKVVKLWATTCFMLALFHDKKCCNCSNFVPCILWDFIVLGLVLTWWRLKLKWRISGFREKLSRERGREEHIIGSWRVVPSCRFRECTECFWSYWEALEDAKVGGCNMELVARSEELDKTRFREVLLE